MTRLRLARPDRDDIRADAWRCASCDRPLCRATERICAACRAEVTGYDAT